MDVWGGVRPRLFTPGEVNQLIPALEDLLGGLGDRMQERAEVAELIQDMEAYWGERAPTEENPEVGKYNELRATQERLAKGIQGSLESIEALGGHLKSVEMGLVDFLHQMGDEVVYLCWRRGEREVGFWHGVGEGLAQRHPLDD